MTRTQQRSASAARGRFARQAAPPRRTATRRAHGMSRSPVRLGRRPQEKSTAGQALERLTGFLPGRAASAGAGGRKKETAGLAALAGAAALAFKKRDRLMGMLGRNRPDASADGPRDQHS